MSKNVNKNENKNENKNGNQATEAHSEYVKKTTAGVMGVVCLVVGFFLGYLYFSMGSAGGAKVRKVTVSADEGSGAAPVAKKGATSAADDRAARLQGLIVQLKRDLQANPNNAESWARLGHAYFDTHQFDEAVGAYNKHLELKPDNANVWTDLGVMYRRKREPKEALRCFDRAISIAPGHRQAMFNKGIVYLFDLQDREAGIKAWEELLKIDPNAATPDGKSLKDLVQHYKQHKDKQK